jgi:hypothetical protein
MKLNNTLVLLALAFTGASASAAANVGEFTSLADFSQSANMTVGPIGAAAHGDILRNATVDDIFNFNIAAVSDLYAYSHEFESLNLSLDPVSFQLYSGTYAGTALTPVGASFMFTGESALTHTYSNLAAGNYYFEITGQAAGALGGDYDFAIFANTPANPLPAVPEPANMALLLGGLGLVGFMAKRRIGQ